MLLGKALTLDHFRKGLDLGTDVFHRHAIMLGLDQQVRHIAGLENCLDA